MGVRDLGALLCITPSIARVDGNQSTMVAAPLRLAALQRVGDARNTSEIESYTSMVLGRGKYGRELHSGSLVANHGSRPYATTLICPEICPKDIKYGYRVLKYGFGCLLRSGLRSGLMIMPYARPCMMPYPALPYSIRSSVPYVKKLFVSIRSNIISPQITS